MEDSKRPELDLARKTLPKPLFRALEHLFAQSLQGCVLVGGTAISGFYFGHRRSDDIDLFTKDTLAQEAAILAVRSLSSIGAVLKGEFRTPQYFRVTATLADHSFTIDAVNDPSFFRVAEFETLANHICVANLSTLFKTKAATMVSRCSEKDLYDLVWLLRDSEFQLEDLIRGGQQIDGGVNGESLLVAVSGTKIRESACDFALKPKASPKEIEQQLVQFQQILVKNLVLHLKKQPTPPLRELITTMRRLRRPKTID